VSVHKEGASWRVKWRENGRQRTRSFTRKGDAADFDIAVRRSLQLGPVLSRELERKTITLGGFLADGFKAYASTLAPATRRHYAWAIDNHLADLIDEPLVGLTVPRLAAHQQQLLDTGRTPNTVRQAMIRLSGILQAAVEHGHLPANPVRAVRKAPAAPREEVKPLSPVDVERLIASLDGRSRAIVLLAGHLGLRPLEVRQARWSDFDGVNLTISRARTKRTAARSRVIAVPAVTARELRAWQLQCGGRDDQPIVGDLGADGLRLWAYKHLDVAARRAIGRDDVTLYTLRHSHASALHYAGWTVPEAARRLGHSPVVHIGVYAHAIDAISGTRYDSLDALIAAARAKLVFRQSSASGS